MEQILQVKTTRKSDTTNPPKPHNPKKPTHPKAVVTFRHNVLPPIIGVLVFLTVLGLLNSQWVTAQAEYYIAPLHGDSHEIVPALASNPSAQPQLIIPSVGIDVPYITSGPSYATDQTEIALRSGVAHFGTTAMPGQIGNVVVIGHSSGSLWSSGQYKYAFTLLGKVSNKALVYIDYRGARYIYRVTSHETVSPTDVSVLSQNVNEPDLTLITGTPIGTSTQRLVLHAVQISPSPANAQRTNPAVGINTAVVLPQ